MCGAACREVWCGVDAGLWVGWGSVAVAQAMWGLRWGVWADLAWGEGFGMCLCVGGTRDFKAKVTWERREGRKSSSV